MYTWEQWERTKAAKGEKDANAEMDAAKKAGKVIVKDAIADITLQQVLTRPDEFDVIATLNLNGDYISDALAAQVGGIGIAPGANINYLTGHAVFEATHGTAPKYANLDKVNPGSVLLSGEMMLRYMGWTEAADSIITAMDRTIGAEDRDVRLRAPDGRREGSGDQCVRGCADPQPLSGILDAHLQAEAERLVQLGCVSGVRVVQDGAVITGTAARLLPRVHARVEASDSRVNAAARNRSPAFM